MKTEIKGICFACSKQKEVELIGQKFFCQECILQISKKVSENIKNTQLKPEQT